jgi:hypothetical protein
MHAVPEAEECPAAQLEHDTAEAAENWPAGHAEHDFAPAAENVSTPQPAQSTPSFAEN